MNIFKKMLRAIIGFGSGKKKENINAINDAPVKDPTVGMRNGFGGGSRWTGYKGETAAQVSEGGRTAWKRGGTHSWARGRSGVKLGRQLPALTIIQKRERRQKTA